MLSALEADRARVADLVAQILDFERSLSALRIEKAQAQERIDSYKYPVLTLPNEIVSEIFVHFMPAHPLFPPLTGIFSPTLLGQICRKWREIALTTSSLWRTIPLSFGRNPQAAKHHAYLCDVWLRRSRCCPLSIQIVQYYPSREVDGLAAVVAQRARWENLKIHVGDVRSYLFTVENPMPLLRHLDVEIEDESTNVIVLCPDAPLLRTVILNDIAALKVELPWAQLTALTLKRVFTHECVPILQRTPYLVHCELNLYLDRFNIVSAELELPCLQSLDLRYPGDRSDDWHTRIIHFKIRLHLAGTGHHGPYISNRGLVRIPPGISLNLEVDITRLQCLSSGDF
ncbi:hypothetical protein B0H19DRAFT_1121453 [Mycena capillaripes]|nr:hypothetical protein B0H19DRAFT_1121453 [Mycena capillaripes]